MLEGHRRLSVSLRGEGLPAADGRGPRAPEPAGAMAAARADADRARRESAARLRLAAHHRDLDATFFHRRLWAAKMERAFVPWVNHLITPRQVTSAAWDGPLAVKTVELARPTLSFACKRSVHQHP